MLESNQHVWYEKDMGYISGQHVRVNISIIFHVKDTIPLIDTSTQNEDILADSPGDAFVSTDIINN